jgi:hypothetical protein
MNSFKRVLPYILINIFISVVSTLIVLWLWDGYQHADAAEPTVALEPEVESASTPQSTDTVQATQDQPLIEIQNVFGVSDLDNEVVVIKRLGTGDLWLTGWKIKDENKHTFTFPKLLLNKDGAVQVYTKPGPNSVIELHWGQSDAIWQTGELVTLLDNKGKLRASYKIP